MNTEGKGVPVKTLVIVILTVISTIAVLASIARSIVNGDAVGFLLNLGFLLVVLMLWTSLILKLRGW